MAHNRTVFGGFLGLIALLALVGCGGGTGGGSSSSSGLTGTRSAVDIYVTDGFNDAYRQVQLTLYKIEVTTDGTNFTIVYENTSGQVINLCSLKSTAELLASVNLPTGTYTQSRVTFGDHLTLVASDGTTTSVAVDSSAGTFSNGKVAVTVSTPTSVTSGQSSTLVIDFKLAEFKLVGSTLKPALGHGDDTALRGKDRTCHLGGTVANLVAGTSFDLQQPDGRTLPVLLTSSTTVVSGQSGTAITLANGQSVLLDGTYDNTTGKFTATNITLNDYTSFNHEQVLGTVGTVTASSTSFTLTVQRANGIQPTGGTITVVTDANTKFVKDRRQTGSFSDVVSGNTVGVLGTFDSTTQTLTAKFVRLQ